MELGTNTIQRVVSEALARVRDASNVPALAEVLPGDTICKDTIHKVVMFGTKTIQRVVM